MVLMAIPVLDLHADRHPGANSAASGKARLHDSRGLQGGFRMREFARLVAHTFEHGGLRTQLGNLLEQPATVHFVVQDKPRRTGFAEGFRVAKLVLVGCPW
jgi:hypothetical protein